MLSVNSHRQSTRLRSALVMRCLRIHDLAFVSILYHWRAFASAERPCYYFRIRCKSDEKRCVTSFFMNRHTLSVPHWEVYCSSVTRCRGYLVSYRSPCSRVVWPSLGQRIPGKNVFSWDTFGVLAPWSVTYLWGSWTVPCSGYLDWLSCDTYLCWTGSERWAWRSSSCGANTWWTDWSLSSPRRPSGRLWWSSVSSQGSFEWLHVENLGCHLQDFFYVCGIGRLWAVLCRWNLYDILGCWHLYNICSYLFFWKWRNIHW